MGNYHTPVLVTECVDLLDPHPGRVYVDATLGGGGHTLALLKRCPQIRVFAFDQDEEAIASANGTLDKYAERVELIRANFARLRTELALRKIKTIDGIIFDLGVSSHQLDTPERGFSFDNDAPLDMRMNQRAKTTAADALNTLSERALAAIFKDYGEEPQAGRIARTILNMRDKQPFATTRDLCRAIEKVAGIGSRESLKTKVRIFQSLRIYVNRELEVLQPTLQDAINILKPGGRIVVLSYQSLEDRVTKITFRKAADGCVCPPGLPRCACKVHKQLVLLNRKPLAPAAEEVAANVRSRSARLRAAEKSREER